MAATAATPVTPTEPDPDRCVNEEESRGAEAEEVNTQQQTGPAAAVSHSRLSKLPLARIKALMKTDPDVSLASQESVFIIAKATAH
ncbi:DNA polymerase epsilon subunit 4 [Perca fluviatilis]|uniref:DNA polymerase epsilon subunit 4 n=1 Tax=Perca fluviatilis TaxID=8168 RepID=UPI001963DFEE|nr:DNA polymerase epsilon subunit 4 [Perca fluviatilis]